MFPQEVLVTASSGHLGEALVRALRERGEEVVGLKRARLSVGKDAAEDDARRMRKIAEFNAVNKGAVIVPEKRQRSAVGCGIGCRLP